MKNRILLPIILSVLLLFVSAGKVYGFDTPFGSEQSFGSSDSQLPSDAAFERINNFGIGSSFNPFAAPPTNPGGGTGIDVGTGTGTDPDHSRNDSRNDAPVGKGLIILLGIAAMHTFTLVLRRKRSSLIM